MISPTPINHHACALIIDGCGVLIEGASGSGKTSVMFGLCEQAQLVGKKVSFISDDQVLISVNNGALIATAPQSIAGKAELFGMGIIDIENIESGQVGLIVRLAPDATIERMPESEASVLLGIDLPLLRVPERHESHAVRLILHKLKKMVNGCQG